MISSSQSCLRVCCVALVVFILVHSDVGEAASTFTTSQSPTRDAPLSEAQVSHQLAPLAGESSGNASAAHLLDADLFTNNLFPFAITTLNFVVAQDGASNDTDEAANETYEMISFMHTNHVFHIFDMDALPYRGLVQNGSLILPDDFPDRELFSASILLGFLPPEFATPPEIAFIVDPIAKETRPHIPRKDVFYLFATFAQQLYVYAHYCKSELLEPVHAVIRHSTPDADAHVLEEIVRTLLELPLQLTSHHFTSTRIADFLSPDGANIIVGVTHDDVKDLVLFLDNNPNATVLISFDEYTLLFDAIMKVFGSTYRPSMDRLLYATNLPPQNAFSEDHMVSMFMIYTTAQLHTPAAMRAFYALYFAEAVTSESSSANLTTLADTVYAMQDVHVGNISFGPFRESCPYPSSQRHCLVNFGAANIYLWSFGSVVANSTAIPLDGPITPPSYFTNAILESEMHDNKYYNRFLFATLGFISMMILHLVVTIIMCQCGCLEKHNAIATVVGVRIMHKPQLWAAVPEEMEQAMTNFCNDVTALEYQYKGTQIECTPRGFVVVFLSSSDALRFVCDVLHSLEKHSSPFPMGTVADLRVGINSGKCACVLPFEQADIPLLTEVVAPIGLLASLLTQEVCSKGGEVMMTEWTAGLLHSMTSCGKMAFVHRYQLDDIITSFGVWRFSRTSAASVEDDRRVSESVASKIACFNANASANMGRRALVVNHPSATMSLSDSALYCGSPLRMMLHAPQPQLSM